MIPLKESSQLFARYIRGLRPIAEPPPLPKGTACEARLHPRRSIKQRPADPTLTSRAVNSN
jgi:hypothetical protein